MGKKYTDEQVNTIRKMTMGGYTQSQIAEEIGASKAGVAYYQKSLNLKASNRWHFGESASKDPISVVEEPIVVPKKEKKKWTIIADQTLILTGANTGFSYTITTSNEIVKIEPTYGPSIEIESKDICSFGNELIDIAERLHQMIEETK